MLDGIANAVSKVVHGVHAPVISRALVRGVTDTVNHRIAHVQVRRSHVNFKARHMGSVGKFSGPHATKQI